MRSEWKLFALRKLSTGAVGLLPILLVIASAGQPMRVVGGHQGMDDVNGMQVGKLLATFGNTWGNFEGEREYLMKNSQRARSTGVWNTLLVNG